MPNDRSEATTLDDPAAGGTLDGPGASGAPDEHGTDGSSDEVVSEQATIGARVDADPTAAPGQPGWWAVTDAGARVFVPEAALAARSDGSVPATGTPDGGRFRTVRSGQRVQLRWRVLDDGVRVVSVGLPPQQPDPAYLA